MPHLLSQKCPIPISTSYFMCVQIFHMVNNDVPASVGAPPLSTQLLLLLNALESSPYSRRICYICSRNICFVVRMFAMNIWMAQVRSLFLHSMDCVTNTLSVMFLSTALTVMALHRRGAQLLLQLCSSANSFKFWSEYQMMYCWQWYYHHHIEGNFHWCKFSRKSVQTLQRKFRGFYFRGCGMLRPHPYQLMATPHMRAEEHWTTKRRNKPVQQRPNLPFVWRLSQ